MDQATIILQISIVGVILSAIVQAIKVKFGTESLETKAITIALAVVLGACIYLFSGTPVWMAIVGVLGVASTIYAFLLK